MFEKSISKVHRFRITKKFGLSLGFVFYPMCEVLMLGAKVELNLPFEDFSIHFHILPLTLLLSVDWNRGEDAE